MKTFLETIYEENKQALNHDNDRGNENVELPNNAAAPFGADAQYGTTMAIYRNGYFGIYSVQNPNIPFERWVPQKLLRKVAAKDLKIRFISVWKNNKKRIMGGQSVRPAKQPGTSKTTNTNTDKNSNNNND